jgi:hypothetical protein
MTGVRIVIPLVGIAIWIYILVSAIAHTLGKGIEIIMAAALIIACCFQLAAAWDDRR